MDQNSDQIVEHIERQRDELGRDLDELQTRVKRTTDWRSHFETHPFYFLGAAFGGGLLLSSITSGRSSSSYPYSSASTSSYPDSETGYSYKPASYSGATASSLGSSSYRAPSPRTQYQKERAMETLDAVKGALIAFAATKAKDMLMEMLPGFDKHLDETHRATNGKGFGSDKDSSSMGSPSATHGSGTPSGASTFGDSPSQSSPQAGGGAFATPSPWSGSGSGTRENV